MDDAAVLSNIDRDDAYLVVRVLADKPAGRTELVTTSSLESIPTELFVRKRIPLRVANREAWAKLQSIHSASLPHIRETYELPDALVVVYDYIEGMSLNDSIASMGPLSAAQAQAILKDVCQAVGALHSQGIIHRDITPTNIILAQDGARLIDFGIARVYNSEEITDTTNLGTWGFAAPEQYGFAQTDERSDIYSLGGLLAFMLTGVKPQEQEFNAVLKQLPPRIQTVLDKARAFEPSSRYAGVDEFMTAWEEAVDGPTLPSFTAQPVRDAMFDPRLLNNPLVSSVSYNTSANRGTSKQHLPSRDEVPAAWQQSSLITKALVVFLLFISGIVICVSVPSAYEAILDLNNIGWGFTQALMYVVVIVVLAWMPLEVVFALLHVGAYQLGNRSTILFLKRCAVIILIAVLLLVVMALLGAIFFGSFPSNSATS